jgi:acetyl-CoA carboxylase biotin carboxylase subunit
VLIANRGEIAVRIIRTCRRLGIETILTVSEADRDTLPAHLADRTVCIGPARPVDSYLKIDTVVQAALGVGAQALHPGYGFLSERAALAQLCEQHGVAFIGPTAPQLAMVGDKLAAREAAEAAGIAVVPGGVAASVAEAQALARRIGLPVLIKAVGGGGGRGLSLVQTAAGLAAALDLAAGEAGAAFGDSRLYLERFVARGRHVEVQVLGDGAGAVVHLGERDCSVQRRYQKILEETPAPQLDSHLRRRMQEAAVRLAASIDYRGAGTVEFLVDMASGEFYFLEMNARIQVEHPVTEMVTGIDLVAEQLAVAQGEGLRLLQQEIQPRGCAMECRINAEDPARDFQPSPGTVTQVAWPQGEGIRVDTHIETGSRVPPYYDSLLAKIIVAGPDRPSVIRAMRAALARTRVDGVSTNIGLHTMILADPRFVHGGVDSRFLAGLLEHAYTGLEVTHG